jgi:hypothetical protein
MTDREIRLECIRLAAQHLPLKCDQVVSLANDYYRWIIGKTDKDISACVEAFGRHPQEHRP